MEKNNSKFSISDAMKIYGGCDPAKQTVIMWSAITLAFLVLYAFMRIVTAATLGVLIGPDDGEVIGGIDRTSFTMFMGFASTIGTYMVQVQDFYSRSAGGKYFRSVCGGFDTYSRMKTGQMVQCICGQALYVTIIFLVNTVFHLVISGPGVCVSVFLVSLSGLAAIRLICMIESQVGRGLLYCCFIGLHAFICTCIVGVTDGKITSVHIVLLIIAAIMLPLIHFTDLKNYRKYYWYD